MKSPSKFAVSLVAIALVSVLCTQAQAQRVRSFDDQVEQPAGAQSQPEAQDRATPAARPDGNQGEQSEEGSEGSYRIRMHGQGTTGQGAPVGSRLEELLRRPQTELYRGIIPGMRDELPGDIDDDERGPNVVTWIGLEPDADRTRVFVQTRRPVQHRTRRGESSQELIAVLENTRITKSNFRRFIDASHFERSVQRIEARQVDSQTVEVVLQIKAGTEPDISSDGRYLRFDFPHDGEGVSRRMSAADEVDPGGHPPSPADGAQAEDDAQLRALEDEEEQGPPDRRLTDVEVDDDDSETAPVTTRRRRVGLLSGIAGVALIGGGGGLAMVADSRRAEITDVPRDEVVPMTQQRAAEIERSSNQMDTAALGMVITGGVALIVGGALWWTAPTAEAPDSSHSFNPRVDPQGGTVGMDWTLRY